MKISGGNLRGVLNESGQALVEESQVNFFGQIFEKSIWKSKGNARWNAEISAGFFSTFTPGTSVKTLTVIEPGISARIPPGFPLGISSDIPVGISGRLQARVK